MANNRLEIKAMSKDPAFLFYDGDAARDVSHMNRLERGCYFDLIQAQRKFGGYTVEQARKILGKDFDSCWGALELILSVEDGIYFIEWVRISILQRKEHAELQRKRIQDYWDKKKKDEENRNIQGNTAVLPLENEDENEIEDLKDIEKRGAGERRKRFSNIPPTIKELEERMEERGITNFKAEVFHSHYTSVGWKIGKNPMKNWDAALTTWQLNNNGKPVNGKPKTRLQQIYEQKMAQ